MRGPAPANDFDLGEARARGRKKRFYREKNLPGGHPFVDAWTVEKESEIIPRKTVIVMDRRSDGARSRVFFWAVAPPSGIIFPRGHPGGHFHFQAGGSGLGSKPYRYP